MATQKDTDKNIVDTTITNQECLNILKCQSLQRVTAALHFYQSMKDDPESMKEIEQLTLEYFSEYKDLLNDYGHLLKIHINGGSTEENSRQFEEIHNYISKHIKCDIKTCQQYVRNNRNRGRMEKKEKDTSLSLSEDRKVLFYMDTLDTIHCYLYHAFDTGFRIKQNEFKTTDDSKKEINDEEKKTMSDDDTDKSLLYTDNQMQKLKTFLVNKRKELDKIAGLHRVENSKFMTTVTGIHYL